MASRSYSDKTLKVLFSLSAGRCAFPDCRIPLIDGAFNPKNPVLLANIAHIQGLADDGPRANPALTATQRNHHSNLLVLCPTHHVAIDTEPDRYPVEVLLALKVRHERWVNDRLTSAIPNVTSSELDIVCKHVAAAQPLSSTPLVAIPPTEKMARNGLGAISQMRLTLGLAQSELVADYLQRMASAVDPKFPGNLRAGFVAEYDKLWDAGLRGDALFVAMSDFTGGESTSDFTRQAAGLAVLAHLFQVCDVFEGAA